MSDPVATPPIPIQQNESPSKLRSIGIKAGIALGAALVIFLIGWFVGRGPVGELRDRAESAETSLALGQDHLHMAEASSLLYRTALDLDARNFGTANDRLDEATALLERVGVAGSQFDSLRAAMTSTDLSVAPDLADQRAAVLGFAEALQSLIPNVEAATPGQSPEGDSARQE